MTTSCLTVFVCLLCAASNAQEPGAAWTYRAQSNLYAAPVVAELHPSPGLETLISDSEARTLRCIAANGEALWQYRGPWTKRQASSATVSMTARQGKTTVAIANGNGVLCALDSQTGEEIWRKTVARVDHGGLIWIDLTDDGRDELVVCGDDGVVRALDADSAPLWSSDTTASRLPGAFTGPLSVCDADGDGAPELFGVTEWGAACLSNTGTVRWTCEPVARCLGAPIVYRSAGVTELAFLSREPAMLHVVRASDGAEMWRCSLLDTPDDYSASALAAADLDSDGHGEIIACDARGHVHCFSRGALRWIFETDKAANAMVSIGDVTGDGAPEVLAAGGDRTLYCLDANGALLWRHRSGLRLLHSPTLADLDLDGKTDIVFGGSDRVLRCLRTQGVYRPETMPWPSRRADAALSGANVMDATSMHAQRGALRRRHRAQVDDKSAAKHVPRTAVRSDETRELLRDGSFERTTVAEGPPDVADAIAEDKSLQAQPNGWSLESVTGTMRRDTAIKRNGGASAFVDGRQDAAVIVSQPVPLDDETRTVGARVFAQCNQDARAQAVLRWIGNSGVVREDDLYEGSLDETDWRVFAMQDRKRPRAARYVQMALRVQGGGVYWDDAGITARLSRAHQITVLANQVGYESGAPKRFTIKSSFPFEQGSFAVVDSNGETVFHGDIPIPARIVGAFDSDWGDFYAQCDFTPCDAPGAYTIRAVAGEVSAASHPFVLAQSTLWDATAQPAYRFFYYQRCGCDVPGYHAACHLDDAAGPSGKQYPLWGGWHDAGDYNTYTNAPYAFGLFQVYRTQLRRWDALDADGNGRSDLVDEILWGADHTRRMIAEDGSAYGAITSGYGFWGPPELETDNQPDTGDERPIRGSETGNDSGYDVATVAAAARCADTDPAYREAALRAYAWRAQRNVHDALQLSAAIDLYAATNDTKLADDAKALADAVPPDQAEVLRRYDAAFGTDHSAAIRDSAVARADAMLANSDNPFGVYMYGNGEKRNFFGTPPDRGGWHVGNSSYILEAAAVAAEAYRYTHDARYLLFVYDQLNWVLGNNPYDLCLMEGVGSKNPPSYHHRYFAAGVPRGAVPGSVVNGITWRAPGEDSPYFDVRGVDVPDFESNEVWLPHNTNYLKALTALYAAREIPASP